MADPAVSPAPGPLAPAWRRVAHTEWLAGDAGDHRRALAQATRFARRTYRLPAFVAESYARHALSPELPAPAALVRLVSALTGRLTVATHAPAATLAREDVALVRGLVRAAFVGLPAAPWPAAPRGATAAWPADGRAAYEATLAHGWLAAHDAAGTFPVGRAGRVAVALYEGPLRVSAAGGGGTGGAREGGSYGRPRFAAEVPYCLTVLAGADGGVPSAVAIDATAAAAFGGARAGGAWPLVAPRERWFVGPTLLPDDVAVRGMSAETRARWAELTGRMGRADRYWYPETWARFLEPGRRVGYVGAAEVERSRQGAVDVSNVPAATWPVAGSLGTAFGPAVERGVCAPPGYCLVQCTGLVIAGALAV